MENLAFLEKKTAKNIMKMDTMYACESWTIMKAKHLIIDAFELWCLEKTLESPLDCKEIQPAHPKGDQS